MDELSAARGDAVVSCFDGRPLSSPLLFVVTSIAATVCPGFLGQVADLTPSVVIVAFVMWSLIVARTAACSGIRTSLMGDICRNSSLVWSGVNCPMTKLMSIRSVTPKSLRYVPMTLNLVLRPRLRGRGARAMSSTKASYEFFARVWFPIVGWELSVQSFAFNASMIFSRSHLSMFISCSRSAGGRSATGKRWSSSFLRCALVVAAGPAWLACHLCRRRVAGIHAG